MGAITKATRQPFQMRGRSYVAFTFSPVVPIAGWIEELERNPCPFPRFFSRQAGGADLFCRGS